MNNVIINKIKTLIHNNSRSSIVARNSILMLTLKGISIGISFLYVPLLLGCLDATRYGIWLTLTSLVSWVALFDIGIGNGLRNSLAVTLSYRDLRKSRELVSTAYISMLVIVLTLIVFFIIIFSCVNWNELLVGHSNSLKSINKIVLVVFCGFFLQFFLGIINSILYAFQKSAFSSLITTIGQFISYIIVLSYVKLFDEIELFTLACIISFVPPLVLFFSSIYLFRTSLKNYCPSIVFFKKESVAGLFSTGIQFFILQIITIILFQSNNIIITHLINSESVVIYNISYKYITVLLVVFNIIATPIWSATTDAWAKNDMSWIKKTNSRLLKIIGLLSFIGIIMVTLSSWVYNIWIKDDVEIPFITTLWMFIYTVLMMLYGSFGYILNGIGKLRLQIICTTAIAVSYIPLAYLFGTKYGLTGVLIAFSIAAAFNVLWSSMQYRKITNGSASGVWIK